MTQFSAHRRLGILIIPIFTCSDMGKVLISRGKHHWWGRNPLTTRSILMLFTIYIFVVVVSLKTLKRREKESLSPPPPYFCVNFLHLFTMLFVVSSPDNQVSKHITKSFMSKHAAPQTRYSHFSKTHSRLITFVFTKVVTWHQSSCFKDISLM